MAIADYQTLMRPLLRIAGDGQVHNSRDAIEALAREFRLTEDERKETLSSGVEVFDNRFSWAKTYLTKARLLESIKKGTFRITERGKGVLNSRPVNIDRDFLMQFPEFVDFLHGQRPPTTTKARKVKTEGDIKTPDETLEISYRTLRQNLAQDLLEGVDKRKCWRFQASKRVTGRVY